MKKIYLLMAGMLSAGTTMAQQNQNGPTQFNQTKTLSKSIYQPRDFGTSGARCAQNIIYSETFADPFNSGWTTSGSGSSANTYQAADLWLHDTDGPDGAFSLPSEIITSSSVNDGFLMMDADFFNGNGGAPVNVESYHAEVVSPVYDLSGHQYVTVSFEHSFRTCCSPAQNNLYLDVSTDGFNNVSATYVLDGDVDMNDASGTFTEYINISNAITGNPATTQIRFRWGIAGSSDNASHYFWQIDDLTIFDSYSHHANIDSLAWTPDLNNFGTFGGFSKIPSHSAANTTLTWSAYLQNVGSANWTDAKLEVLEDGNPFATSASETVNILSYSTQMAAGAQMSSNIATHTYSVFGTDTTDMCIMDTMEFDIDVTSDAYSTGGNTITGVQSGDNWVWTTQPARVGFGGEIISTCSSTETVVGVRVAFQDTSLNNFVPMEVMIRVNDVTVSTESFTVDPAFYGSFQPVALSNPVVVNSGDVVDYLIVDNDAQGRFLEGGTSQYTIGLLVTFDGANTMSGPFLEAPIIAEMIVCEDTANCTFLSLEEPQLENIASLQQNIPNPFNQNTQINFNLTSNESCLFEVRDVTGQLVKRIDLGIQSAGQNQIHLNANDFGEGIYFYTLIAGDESLTKKMVILK